MTATLDELRKRPWKDGQSPRDLSAPTGMIGPEERACFYWLGRNWTSGAGVIVDAGSFLGASTHCFAAGAADAGHGDFHGRKFVHAFDYFKVIDKYVGDAISRDFRPIAQGESYLDLFEAQTAPFSEIIAAYPGDFLTHSWDGTPIEVLFIDIAKTAALNSHVVKEFFPALIPERSVVVQQDYFHCWHPYIHITMEFFAEELELIDEHVPHQSRVWRLAAPLPAEKIARIAAYDLSAAERLALLDRLIEKSSDHARPMIEVARLWQQCLDRDWAGARAAFDGFAARYDLEKTRALWVRQAQRVESHIQANSTAI